MKAGSQMAVSQKQWYHFGVGAPPILVYFSWDWDVHWGYDLDFDPWPDSWQHGGVSARELPSDFGGIRARKTKCCSSKTCKSSTTCAGHCPRPEELDKSVLEGSHKGKYLVVGDTKWKTRQNKYPYV